MKNKIINSINIFENFTKSFEQLKKKNYQLTKEKIISLIFIILPILFYFILFYEKPLTESQKKSIKSDANCISYIDIGVKYIKDTKSSKFYKKNNKIIENLNSTKIQLQKNIENKTYFSHSEFKKNFDYNYNINFKENQNFYLDKKSTSKKYLPASDIRKEAEKIANQIQNCIKRNNL